MKFTIEIDCDNAAFEDGNLHQEVARILSQVQKQLLDDRDCIALYDINGNRVGVARFEE